LLGSGLGLLSQFLQMGLVLLDELLDFGLGNGFVQAISYKTRSAMRIDVWEITVVAGGLWFLQVLFRTLTL
jgi:hypothetical protein